VFLDGSSQATDKGTLGAVQPAAGKEEFRQAMLLMLGLFRQKLGPDKIMLLNGADAGEETADVAQYGKLCDGIYMEPPVASKVLTPGRVGRESLEKVVDSKRMTPATERDADEPKDCRRTAAAPASALYGAGSGGALAPH
jgi:hypothetical protein